MKKPKLDKDLEKNLDVSHRFAEVIDSKKKILFEQFIQRCQSDLKYWKENSNSNERIIQKNISETTRAIELAEEALLKGVYNLHDLSNERYGDFLFYDM